MPAFLLEHKDQVSHLPATRVSLSFLKLQCSFQLPVRRSPSFSPCSEPSSPAASHSFLLINLSSNTIFSAELPGPGIDCVLPIGLLGKAHITVDEVPTSRCLHYDQSPNNVCPRPQECVSPQFWRLKSRRWQWVTH